MKKSEQQQARHGRIPLRLLTTKESQSRIAMELKLMLAHHYSSMIVMEQCALLFGLKFLIEQFHFIDTVTTSNRIERDAIVKQRPGILLLECALIRQSLDLIRELKRDKIIKHIIVLYDRDEELNIEDYWSSGIVSYLPANSTQKQLMVALEGELCGLSVFPSQVAGQIGLRNSAASVRAMLSDSERAVLEQVAAGNTNQQIARSMHLSVRTIETYLNKIYRKLGVRNRAEAITKYWQAAI